MIVDDGDGDNYHYDEDDDYDDDDDDDVDRDDDDDVRKEGDERMADFSFWWYSIVVPHRLRMQLFSSTSQTWFHSIHLTSTMVTQKQEAPVFSWDATSKGTV